MLQLTHHTGYCYEKSKQEDQFNADWTLTLDVERWRRLHLTVTVDMHRNPSNTQFITMKP